MWILSFREMFLGNEDNSQGLMKEQLVKTKHSLFVNNCLLSNNPFIMVTIINFRSLWFFLATVLSFNVKCCSSKVYWFLFGNTLEISDLKKYAHTLMDISHISLVLNFLINWKLSTPEIYKIILGGAEAFINRKVWKLCSD